MQLIVEGKKQKQQSNNYQTDAFKATKPQLIFKIRFKVLERTSKYKISDWNRKNKGARVGDR